MNNEQRLDTLLEASMPDVKIIRDLIYNNGVDPQDVMRALVLIKNVKTMCEWGRVGFTIKHGEVISVWQEQQFISDKELK